MQMICEESQLQRTWI